MRQVDVRLWRVRFVRGFVLAQHLRRVGGYQFSLIVRIRVCGDLFYLCLELLLGLIVEGYPRLFALV